MQMKIVLPELKEQIPTWIDVWYDRRSRSWVAQLKDDEFNPFGDSEYGSKEWMSKIYSIWVKEYSLEEKHIKEMQKKQKERIKSL